MENSISPKTGRIAPRNETLKTQSRGKPFVYTKSAKGFEITYGRKPWTYTLATADYVRLLATFKGRTVRLGTSRDRPPRDSVGEWLQENVTKTAIAAYVGPILVAEGDAEWVDAYSLRVR
jgi:hypothetical protein